MKAFFNIPLVTAVCSLTLASAHAAEGWVADLEAAKAQAKKENKTLLIKFTGSDWCPPCIAIDKAVFSKKEFVAQVQEKFVLCIIDVPKGDKVLAKKNKPLLKQYKVTGYPTCLLLDSEGKEFSRYNPGAHSTVEKMVKHMTYQLRRKDMF